MGYVLGRYYLARHVENGDTEIVFIQDLLPATTYLQYKG